MVAQLCVGSARAMSDGCYAVAVAAALCALSMAHASPPHIVVILADDLVCSLQLINIIIEFNRILVCFFVIKNASFIWKKQRKKSDMSSKLFGILNNINQNKRRIIKYFWLLYLLIIYYEYYSTYNNRPTERCW